MKRFVGWLVLVGLVFFLASGVALADCGSDCAGSCDSLKGQEYEDCMVSCLQDCVQYDPPEVPEVPEPTPVEPESN